MFTPDELASMTPAEREAVTHMDDSDTKFINGDDGDDGDTDAGKAAAGAAAGNDEGGAAADEATKGAQKDAVALVEFDDAATEKVAPYMATEVEDYEGKMAELEVKKDEAFKQLMAGEITDSAYRTIEREVGADIRRLDRDMTKAEVAGEMTRQHAASTWLGYVEQQLEASKAAGADLQGSVELMGELDRTVKMMAKQAEDEPSMVKHLAPTKPGVLITNVDKWVLAEAIKIVRLRNGLGDAPAAKANEKAQERGRAPDLSGIPPSLARVPVAADPNTGGDEFAYLNKLNGVEYEKALSRLTPEQIERYTA